MKTKNFNNSYYSSGSIHQINNNQNNQNNQNNHNKYNNDYKAKQSNSSVNKQKVSWKDNYDSLSDSINDDNTNISIKNDVLDYLYNKIEVADHKYILIKNIGDVYELKNKKYYVSGNTCGINSFLIFMKKADDYHSYLVDRRSISYNRNTLKKTSVRFTKIKLAVDPKLYEGTIIDGILIDNDNTKIISKGEIKSNKMMFMITDVFNFCGKSLLSMNYKNKMYMINTLLNEFVEKNKNNTNNIELFINRPFELNQTCELFSEYIEKYIKKYNIKGLSFYPENSGTKLIYLFDKQDDKFRTELSSGSITINTNAKEEDNLQLLETSDSKKTLKFELVNAECTDKITLNLEMRKTNIPDVYKLYGIFFSSNKYIKRRIGIAYIPTYVISLKFKILFLNSESKIVNCCFNPYKGKWIPLNESSGKKIDIINNEKRLKIIEEEVIDQDFAIDD
jgi:hypothetical protein